MKQIIQDLSSGDTVLAKLPVPQVKYGHVLIKTQCSLVSLGTERMLVNFGKANFLDKARQQPDKVKQVFQKIQSDGLRPTLDAVFRKLGEPMPLGYCNAGEVIGVGEDVTEFKIGDRVVSNGHHAEVVNMPKNLVAKIPDGVPYEAAAFTVIGAIALQGIRLIKPTFGETVVVTGLGLIGLLASQILVANGCQVIGLDFDQNKVELAKSWGVKAYNVAATDVVRLVADLTNQTGADAVLITASTKSNEVIAQAAQMSRKRGRIVLVGVVGLNIMRADFYEKELSFQVSCSYGPGRYDTEYEKKGNDYPLPYVRWTQKRNFEAILKAMADKKLKVEPLITEIVELEDYHKVYDNMANSQSIATIIKYKGEISIKDTSIAVTPKIFQATKGILGIIGAGNFTKAVIVPTLKKLNANIKYIASSEGLSGTTTAKKHLIAYSTTDYQDILLDESVDAVLITTQHHAHAQQVIDCLKAGKHVFVEKPLAITNTELNEIIQVYQQTTPSISVGFNRRFSPFMIDAKQQLGNTSDSPIHVIATMNAGFVPAQHWLQDNALGGGRIIGEACHLIDLITYLADSVVEKVIMNALGTHPDSGTDNGSILLKYKNGTNGVINYFANGHKAYSKERIEIYAQGRTMIIDNFRKSKYYGFKKSGLSMSQDKGHNNQFKLFLENLQKNGKPTIPFEQVVNTSRTAIAAVDSLKTGQWIKISR